MFDGNHRVRREVNLGGGGGSRRRGGAAAGRRRAGGPPLPSSAAAPTTGRAGAASTAALTASSSSSRGGKASGVPDRKADILENARVERERRREEKRRNDAAGTVQRLRRGRAGRRGAAAELGGRIHGGGAAAGAASSPPLTGRDVRERASALSALLGPALRPFFLVAAGSAAAASAATTTTSAATMTMATATEEEAEIAALLALGAAWDALPPSDDPWTAAPPGGRGSGLGAGSGAGSGPDADANADAARANFVRGRLVRRSLSLLRGLRHDGEAAKTKTAAAAATAAKARGLARLAARLVGAPDLASASASASAFPPAFPPASAENGGGAATAPPSPPPILLPVLRNGPRTSKGEGHGLVLLFESFRERLWSSSAAEGSPRTASRDDDDDAATARALLRLSCRAAAALLAASAGRGAENADDDNSEDDAALSVLAAAIFCSRPSAFRQTLPSPGGGGGGGAAEGEGEAWGAEFELRRGRLGGATAAAAAVRSRDWHGALLSPLARTLLAPASSSASASAARGVAAAAVAGREVPLLANAFAYLDRRASARRSDDGGSGFGGGNGDGSGDGDGGGPIDLRAACGVARLLRPLLRDGLGGRLAVLAAAAAAGGGEDVRRALLLDAGGGGGTSSASAGAAAAAMDLTNGDGNDSDDDDESSDEEDDDDGDSDERAAAAGGRPAAARAPRRPPPPPPYRRARGSSRLSRQQIQTVPKLDRKYRAEAARAGRDAAEAVRRGSVVRGGGGGGFGDGGEELEATADLCATLGGGGGGTMVRLGAALLVPGGGGGNGGGGGGAPVSDSELESARSAYVEALSDLLQFCSSSRPGGATLSSSSSSSLLSAVAFHPPLLGALWSRCRRPSSPPAAAAAGGGGGAPLPPAAAANVAAFSAFCDAFGRRLVAVDDEEFLADYCRAPPATTGTAAAAAAAAAAGAGGTGIVRADEVVSALRDALYELYWTRPVLAEDVVPPSCVGGVGGGGGGIDGGGVDDGGGGGGDGPPARRRRARLLLSGTGLYNSLHERWCRLPRERAATASSSSPATSSSPPLLSFCSEGDWHFPRLVTRERDDDGAVVPGAASASSSAAAAGRGDADVEMAEEEEEDSDSSPMDVDEGVGGGGGAAAASRSAADEESDALASSFSDPKMARVLTSVPQALPFERRVRLFSSLLDADKARTQDEERSFRAVMMRMQREDMDSDEEWEFTGREKVEIRRDRLYEDSMDQLNRLGRKLRRKVQVTFINRHGAQEAGIDGGGVFKEFLDDLIRDAFDPQRGHGRGDGADGDDGNGGAEPLFAESPVQTLQVNPAAGMSRSTLAHYEFLGRVLGKAVYESILVEPQFCLPFLNQLLGKRNTIDDLKNLDPEYYRHLNALRKMSEKDIDGLGLTFEYTSGGGVGVGGSKRRPPRTVELVPGGGSAPVSRANVIRYVHLVAHRKLNAETSPQTRAFLRGFRDLVPAAWVRLFSSRELQKVIGGDDSVRGIDVRGLRSVTQYAGGYHPSQPVMVWFWQVLEEMTARQQRNFLRFMTSCSRQPLLGFRALVPLPCVQQIRLREDGGGGGGGGAAGRGDVRLPTSSTCMNLLKLPNYPSKEMLREKLLYAIEAGAGFELS